MKNNTTYLLSTFKKNPNRIFQGYCFDEENFIFGQGGADKYYKETNREIAFGEDGCYVLAKKIGENYLIGSDSSGYKKILYFKDPVTGAWAVSNSINILVEHLAENSIKVTPNILHLKMSSVGSSATQQPITFNTIVNEIKILPINTLLFIGDSVFEINKLNKADEIDIDYRAMLLKFVNIWISRYATLMSCENMVIEQGLTGGLDSRALFSLSNYTYHKKKCMNSADYRLISGLTRGDDTDLKIAQEISNHYGYELNDKRNSSYIAKSLSNEEKYLGWKNICLGLYQPIYFPTTRVSYKKISIGGHGGENHRIFYAKSSKINSYNDFIKSLCGNLNDSDLKIDLAINLCKTLNELQRSDAHGKEIDPLILHYRHFRSRFHSGLFPQYRVSFTPLSSRYLNKIAVKENYEKIKNSQILYDLIGITNDLINFPFDSVKKAPNEENLAQLVKLNNNLCIKVGSVYIEEQCESESMIINNKKSVFEYLKDDFNIACNTKLVKKIWDSETISKASVTLNNALEKGRFNHATEGIQISAIISTGIFK